MRARVVAVGLATAVMLLAPPVAAQQTGKGAGEINTTGDCRCKVLCREGKSTGNVGRTVAGCYAWCECQFEGCRKGGRRTPGEQPTKSC
jgi:hypothetical protein